MQQTTGRAALIANNLPSAKTVTNATNATPIVVTTSTAHGLKTNEIIVISGVTGNTAANGTFIAGTVTSNTVTLLAYPAGTSVAGSGAYVSGGTLQSYGYGLTVPIPNDLTDMMRAGSVDVPFEALLDMTAYLLYRATYIAGNYLPLAGGTMSGLIDYCSWRTQSGQTDRVMSGATLQLDSGSVLDSDCTISAGSSMTALAGAQIDGELKFPSTSVVQLLGDTTERATVDVTDADQTIAVGTANEFILATPTATGRKVTLKSTSPTPKTGAWMILSLPTAGTSPTDKWSVQREDATEIGQLRGWDVTTGLTQIPCFMKVQFRGGVWRGVYVSFGGTVGAGF